MTAPDRLALAVRVMKARRTSICPVCRGRIFVGNQIARVIHPAAWIHIACVPIVAALHDTTASERPATEGRAATLNRKG